MGTSYFVANGSDAGVKMSGGVADQREGALTGGSLGNQGTLSGFGILPTTTIGSLKTTRTSLASASFATSPTGPALRMVRSSAALATLAAKKRSSRLKRFMQRAC